MEASSPLARFLHWEKQKPSGLFLNQPINGGKKTWTYQEAGTEIRKMASAIKALGYPDRSNIAILSKNCAHWVMADLAIMMTGHVSVPLYATLTAPSIKQILDHSESKAIIIGKLDEYATQQEGISSGIARIGVEMYGVRESLSWEKLVEANPPIQSIYNWGKDDLMTIMYTSGTTGMPKGVMHTAGNFDVVLRAAIEELGLPMEPSLFSYLPMSHIAERMGIEVYGFYSGAQFSFAESLDTFPKNLFETQPHSFFAVPRIWAKFREKILEKMPQKKLSRLLSIPIIGGIVKKSIRKKLGLSRATHIYSGAAPISVDLLEWFKSIGIEIFQAIGMTEDCVFSHFNRHGKNKIGSVGIPFKNVKVKIADDGELRLKSDANMKGYYKEPGLTAESFDEEGYLKTGDKGEIDSEGFLTIVGRIKDQFKTDKGKYVAPAPIEMKLLANTDIEQVCVVGMGIPQPIALTVLSAAGKTKSKEAIIESLSASLKEVNAELESYEKIEKAVIMQGEWTVPNGLMTPTMKVKRNEVEKIHVPKYPAWYHTKEGAVIWE
ncbi:MAG: AMP-binding protein [Cyclobacteriaceae bacterium]|jgi:long-chain acyl-CoA synthetase|nr:AMP-binding protein [Flammeovirgaceae bacterium]